MFVTGQDICRALFTQSRLDKRLNSEGGAESVLLFSVKICQKYIIFCSKQNKRTESMHDLIKHCHDVLKICSKGKTQLLNIMNTQLLHLNDYFFLPKINTEQ